MGIYNIDKLLCDMVALLGTQHLYYFAPIFKHSISLCEKYREKYGVLVDVLVI